MRLTTPRFLLFSLLFVTCVQAQDLPDGPGKDVFAKMCSACHGLDIITGLKHSRGEWKAVVDTMAGYGAQGKDEEFDAVVSYLAKNFGRADAASLPVVYPRTVANVASITRF